MTTPDETTPERDTPDQIAGSPATAGPNAIAREGAWGAVARLLAVQLLTVVAVTAVITGIYALTGPGHNQATAGSSSPGTPTASLPPTSPPPTQPSTEPSVDPSASATSSPATPTTSSQPPVRMHHLKVDVLNQSAAKGAAGRFAARVRGLHWRVGRVSNFNGTVSTTTIYFPQGQAKAAHELAKGLRGNLRVLPRFSTLSDSRLTLILTG